MGYEAQHQWMICGKVWRFYSPDDETFSVLTPRIKFGSQDSKFVRYRARSNHIFRNLRSLTILLPNCDLWSLTITFSKSWTIRSRSWSAIILPITPLLCLIIQRAVFLWKEPYILKAHDLGMSQILRLRAAFGINIWIFPLENGYKGNEIRSKIPLFAITT